MTTEPNNFQTHHMSKTNGVVLEVGAAAASSTHEVSTTEEDDHHHHHDILDLGSIDTQKLFQLDGERLQRRSYANKLTAREMDSLAALCDTFLPGVDVPDGVVDESIAKFWSSSASTIGTPDYLGGLISHRLVHHKSLLRLALFLLSSWLGTLILTEGRSAVSVSPKFPHFRSFSQLPLRKRQQIIRRWQHSCVFLHRWAHVGFKNLIMIAFFTQLDEKDENVAWKAIGYKGPDPKLTENITTKITLSKHLGYLIPKDNLNTNLEQLDHHHLANNENSSGPLLNGVVNTSNSCEIVAEKLRQFGFHVSVRRNKKKYSMQSPSMIIRNCDAVIVGSGSGGGVVAGMLANAGYRVLVLEKGSYCARNNLSLLEGPGLDQMYEGNGLLSTDDIGVVILAGSTVGGGSTVNWSASLPTPQHVLKEWSNNYELELFDSKLYQEATDVVCQKMGVQSEIDEEGFNNEILRRGCHELGYPVKNIPRNAPADHYCGWCFLGCKDGRKKGTSETWLRDVVETGNGVILPECTAKKVLRHRLTGRARDTATGVLFEFNHKGVKESCIVESKVTIVAGGSLNTPILLKKSGLKNPNIGKHLHLHPVVMAWGHFPESLSADSWPENEKKSYEGGIMTAMSTIVSNIDASGYGAIIQTPSLHPGLYSALMPWKSGIDMKINMTKFSRTAHLIALARDRGSGEVNTLDKIRYKIDSTDQANLNKGMEAMLRILAAAGAEEIGTHHLKCQSINVKKVSCREFERFVKRESSRSFGKQSIPLASAHQMGSCRMGVDSKNSVVNQMGEAWEVEGLYLADGSVLPTALGVNPMVTIQSIAYCTGQSVLELLKRKKS